MMKKPWSITTTLRDPKRVRNFLIILQQLEGSEWNFGTQKRYQILLIKNRIYGYREHQFYNRLSQDKVDLIDDSAREISFEQAMEIFNEKNYKDPAMRGRQSINVLKKMGFVVIKNEKIAITDLGRLFLKDDFDLGEIFFRSFLKWQIPNPDYPQNGGYDIKPFLGSLHLIKTVNQKEIDRGNNPKGLSKKEFSRFAPTLVDYRAIDSYAENIVALREKLRGKTQQKEREIFDAHGRQFASEFMGTDDENAINRLLKNLQDYGDNAIRYFRLTRYIYIRGHGFYVDLEPRRSVEIDSLLAHDNAQSTSFGSKEEYLSYLADISEPQLPWETTEKYVEIIDALVREIRTLTNKHVDTKGIQEMQSDALKGYIADLRAYRRLLQEAESHRKSQDVEEIRSYIQTLEKIFSFNDRPILLEKLSALSLYALDDALKIQPNCPVGDDNEPTFTAPANTPDIECFYENFNTICEVTMLTGREQWYNEGQPVMRHLRDFENRYPGKPTYCLFIAPKLHIDTIETFWTSIKVGYRGQTQKIIPLSINHFVSILRILLQLKIENRFLKHAEILRLYDKILDSANAFDDSRKWQQSIPNTISSWQENLISQT